MFITVKVMKSSYLWLTNLGIVGEIYNVGCRITMLKTEKGTIGDMQ